MAVHTISYKEGGFIVPEVNNWQQLHLDVYDTVLAGVNSRPGRNFIYAAFDEPSVDNGCFIIIRTSSEQEFSDKLVVSDKTFKFQVGDIKNFKIENLKSMQRLEVRMTPNDDDRIVLTKDVEI